MSDPTDDLRTRIAAALERADKEPQPFDQGPVGYEYLADAVLAELGLRRELWVTEDPVIVRRSWGKPPVHRRYVTEWEYDDE